MARRGGRTEAEAALKIVRALVARDSKVLGTGLGRAANAFVIRVMVRSPISDLPAEIRGVSVQQEIREPPESWC